MVFFTYTSVTSRLTRIYTNQSREAEMLSPRTSKEPINVIGTQRNKMRHKPSAKGTTIRARSTKTVLVRCWETPTDSGSWNFTKQTREVTGKGESLKENIDTFARCTHSVHTPPAETLELTLTLSNQPILII